DFLAPLPVGKLHGVGRVMESKLFELGIATVGQLRAYGEAELERRFGRWGRRLHELSRGIDDHPVVSERPTLQISAEDTFERDLRLHETEDTLRRLASKVWAAAQKEPDRIGRTVVLKLKTSDFRLLTRSFTPAQPPASEQELTGIALALRERVGLPSRTRFRLVGVGLANFRDANALPPQSELFG
ncbi:MAG: DNA polymerase IV, partial [Arenimonas sp.]